MRFCLYVLETERERQCVPLSNARRQCIEIWEALRKAPAVGGQAGDNRVGKESLLPLSLSLSLSEGVVGANGYPKKRRKRPKKK
jgi:hypothetical protein